VPVTLSPGLDLSAYRILQEGLTNALRHAHAERAQVRVQYGPSQLELEVRDDGRGPTASDGMGHGLGHGLVGLRERVKIYGGEMTAEPAPGRGFVLRTRLPIERRP
jgi:signal transduction histidine kinase